LHFSQDETMISLGELDLQTARFSDNDSLAERLDHMFRERLCRLVEREMNARYRCREDAEDVVQSVFRTFFCQAASGKFEFHHQGALWNLLRKLARHKILKHIRYQQAQSRDPRHECPLLEDCPAEGPTDVQACMLGDALEVVLSGLEPPEPELFALQLHGYSIGEICELVLRGLAPPYPQVLQLRLQGESESQIASRLECGREAVRYRLRRIRERLCKLLADEMQ
jgi:RNA polymerase sigma-70 factor, ECF subfamily